MDDRSDARSMQMSNLSLDFSSDFRPLAARMRPQTLEQYIGQQHILGPDKPLRKAILAGHCHSLILWGPPGTDATLVTWGARAKGGIGIACGQWAQR